MIVSTVHIATGQQEQLYTQFMFGKLTFNPAYAGSYETTSFTALFRNQWVGFPGAPKTQLLSINAPVSNQRIGFGLTATNSSIGISERQTLDGAYSYRFSVGETGFLSIGLQSSLRRYTVDFTDERLLGIDGIALDPSISPQIFNRNIVNFGAGIYYSQPNFYFGLSAPRLSEADLDFDNSFGVSREARIFYAMTGSVVNLSNDWIFTPQLLFKYANNLPWDLDVNLSFTYKDRLTAGMSYRHGGDSSSLAESIDLIFGVQMTDALMLGVAYDFSLTGFREQSSGSVEGVIRYIIGRTRSAEDEVNPRYF